MATRTIWAHGIATIAEDTVLDARFERIQWGEPDGSENPFEPFVDDLRGVTGEPVTVAINLDSTPASTPDAYLRLHALSTCLVQPNTVSLEGIFGLLPNVAWTTHGPMAPERAAAARGQLQAAGVSIVSLDKFPRLLDYVIPERVRIADASRVRLGAHLAPGTTVMHEGFVNFNAGTLGASMVEGRISQGVVVGDGSDVGGGASIMGTLSGGGTERVRIGERSLLGANSGIGISIGDDCIVEAGLYLTAGSKVVLADAGLTAAGNHPTAKAIELSGQPNLLFRRNSLTGAIEALSRSGKGVTLNSALHA
ncbi:MAG TPA: DapH/DapD/GlmU-related protein [Microbacteriaceae bacterium]|nr:DapH/DapD/GlmU-related protein [Microbacteriaceae bacterium]